VPVGRVLVPYSETRDPLVLRVVMANLSYQGHRVAYVRVSEDTDYAQVVSDWWSRPFILVEHDILPWPGALERIWECSEPWCRYAYPLGDPPIIEAYLGCVKFRPEALGPIEIEGKTWRELDGTVEKELTERGFQAHLHEPPVIHLGAEVVP